MLQDVESILGVTAQANESARVDGSLEGRTQARTLFAVLPCTQHADEGNFDRFWWGGRIGLRVTSQCPLLLSGSQAQSVTEPVARGISDTDRSM